MTNPKPWRTEEMQAGRNTNIIPPFYDHSLFTIVVKSGKDGASNTRMDVVYIIYITMYLISHLSETEVLMH